uniref:Uncharacterized protein n=1 Tax=Romanomermis culicivorax TaxID=13658 RepID=A0A915I2B7_ROMCU
KDDLFPQIFENFRVQAVLERSFVLYFSGQIYGIWDVPCLVCCSPSMLGGVEKFSTTLSMLDEQIFSARGSPRGACLANSLPGAVVLAKHLRAQPRA